MRMHLAAAGLGAATLLLLAPAVSPANAQSATARLRAVNVVSGVRAINVIVDGQEAIRNIPYRSASPYIPLSAGAHAAAVEPVPAVGASLGAAVRLNDGMAQTLVATGGSGASQAILLADDDTTPAPGKARVRFVHASPDTPAVDVAVPGKPPVFSNVSYGQSQGPFELDAPHTYALDIRLAGTDTVVLHDPNVTVLDGQVVTLFTTGAMQNNTLSWIPVLYAGPGMSAASMPATGMGPSGRRMAWTRPAALLLLVIAMFALGAARLVERTSAVRRG